MSQRTIAILGGALSGPTAAAHARETDPDARIILLERAAAISYAVGGLPYVLSGEIASNGDIDPYDTAFFRRDYDVDVRTGVQVDRLDAGRREVHTRAGVVRYDSLVYALGAGSFTPPGFEEEAENLSFLRNPAHLRAILDVLAGGAERVAIVGGGYYGVEAADCLARRGLRVTLLERGPQLLPEFSSSAAKQAADALAAHGVEVRLGAGIDRVVRRDRRIVALEVGGTRLDTDLVLLTAGVRPRTELFVAAGGRVLPDGSIPVDARCATNLDGVYATSICVSHRHAVTGRSVWTAQASDADKTAQVAGRNAAGGAARLGPTLGTAIVRAGDLHVARTGFTQLGGRFDAARVKVTGSSCDPFFRGSAGLDVTLYYARRTERLLGAEVVGRGGVDKRIDVLATAVLARLDLAQLSQLDLAYSPPYSTARDIVNTAGVVGMQARDVQAWDAAAVSARAGGARVIDVRSAEARAQAPYPAELASLEDVRAGRVSFPEGAPVVFVCETGRTAWLAARAAAHRGCAGAGYLSGGLRALRALGGEA
jgi:NADPH-dependent 2,4-dienoyl-CoA reductase/sulfur reductase-like enzyme/rhodanese-related sulfurtransferase